MDRVSFRAFCLFFCLCVFLVPRFAQAEWVPTYTRSPQSCIDEYGDVVLENIQFVPKDTLHFQHSDQIVQCTLTWHGDDPAPRYVKVFEYASAAGGGQGYVIPLSVFRGYPRGASPGPCPIILKGAIMSPRTPTIKFTYQKVKMGVGTGSDGNPQSEPVPVTTDDFGLGEVESKHDVPESELRNWGNDVRVKVTIDPDHPAEEGMRWYNFEAIWNQTLPRSLTKKFSSKKAQMPDGTEIDVGGGDIAGGPHYWQIRAEAIIPTEFGFPTDPIVGKGVKIQIFSLAPPVDAPVHSGYGSRTGSGWTYAKTTDDHYVFIVTKPGNEIHNGYDYTVPAGQTVYASQQGTLEPGPFIPSQEEPIPVADADALWTFMKNKVSDNASDWGIPPDADPNSVLLCVLEAIGTRLEIRNTYIGPNWLIRSFKKDAQEEQPVTYKFPNRAYETTSLVPAYGHLQPSPSDASKPIQLSPSTEVELGEGIGTVGDWPEDTPKGRLSLGYIS